MPPTATWRTACSRRGHSTMAPWIVLLFWALFSLPLVSQGRPAVKDPGKTVGSSISVYQHCSLWRDGRQWMSIPDMEPSRGTMERRASVRCPAKLLSSTYHLCIKAFSYRSSWFRVPGRPCLGTFAAPVHLCSGTWAHKKGAVTFILNKHGRCKKLVD